MASGKFWQALVNVIDTDPDSPFHGGASRTLG